MERTLFFIVGLVLGLLTGCSTPERGGLRINRVDMPEWTRTGVHPDFPESDYLVAFGLARTEKEAAEVAEQRLEAMICDYAIQPNEILFKDTQFQTVVTEPAGWFRLGEFGRAVQGDVASDGFETVVARAINFNELELRARSMLQPAINEFETASRPPVGLGSIPKRMEMWGEYYLKCVRAVALELIAAGTLNKQGFDEVENALISLWELPTICQSDQWGGNQHLRLREGLPDPIGLKLYFRGKPVTGVPIAWGPGVGFQGTVEGDRELDDRGIASAQVLYLTPTGDDFAYVQAHMDIDKLVGRRLGIAMNVWLWKVMLPSRGNGELLVNVKETEQGEQPPAKAVFYPELEKWCLGRNLAVSSGTDLNKEKLYHLLLEGNVDVTSSVTDGVPTAYVSGVVTLSDVETGQTLFSFALGQKEVGQSGNTETAIRMLAMRQGVAEMMTEMASRILAALPDQGDEFGREQE